MHDCVARCSPVQLTRLERKGKLITCQESMAETLQKSVGLRFDSWHVTNLPFLSNLVSCTGEHLATQSVRSVCSSGATAF